MKKIDSSCMERISIAVESLLLHPDSSKAIESATLSISVLQARDFPTPDLAKAFHAIMEKLDEYLTKWKSSPDYCDPRSVELQYLCFSSMNGQQKFWFKRKIWDLYQACLFHNDTE